MSLLFVTRTLETISYRAWIEAPGSTLSSSLRRNFLVSFLSTYFLFFSFLKDRFPLFAGLAGSSRAGSSRAGSSRAGSSRTGSSRTGSSRTGAGAATGAGAFEATLAAFLIFLTRGLAIIKIS